MSAERLGIPAVAIIAHPVAGNTDDELRAKAEQAVSALVPLLTRRKQE